MHHWNPLEPQSFSKIHCVEWDHTPRILSVWDFFIENFHGLTASTAGPAPCLSERFKPKEPISFFLSVFEVQNLNFKIFISRTLSACRAERVLRMVRRLVTQEPPQSNRRSKRENLQTIESIKELIKRCNQRRRHAERERYSITAVPRLWCLWNS